MKVHSIQSLGTLDGPGIRFVVFLQGCHLRCKCCHNPDTWDGMGGQEMSPEELVSRASRYKEYYGEQGGITLSGGEPLLQAESAYRLFELCRQQGINTCLDTSGALWNDHVDKLLTVTDRVLLDVKYTDNCSYEANVGCSIDVVMEFLSKLQQRGIPTTIRQVIIPTLNDTAENIEWLRIIRDRHPVVDLVELLPFHKMCQSKYDQMGKEFPLKDVPEPTQQKMNQLKTMLNA